MLRLRLRSGERRGQFDFGWLQTKHSFSFGEFYDPEAMGFRSLRVINDDVVQAAQGFGTHPHRDMEIITYVLEGELEHKDSMGNGSVIRSGDVQYMSAGSGVTHSEFNPSKKSPVHLLQIWVVPNERSAQPRYDQKNFSVAQKTNRLCTIASPDGRDGSVAIRQDAMLMSSVLESGRKIDLTIPDDRGVYVHLIDGSLTVTSAGAEVLLNPGDACEFEDELKCQFQAIGQAGEKSAHFLCFVL